MSQVIRNSVRLFEPIGRHRNKDLRLRCKPNAGARASVRVSLATLMRWRLAPADKATYTLMAWNEGWSGLDRPVAADGVQVGVTHSSGSDPEQDFARARLRHGQGHD